MTYRKAVLFAAATLLLAIVPAPSVSAEPRPRDYVVGFHSLPADRQSYDGDAVVADNEALGFLVVRAKDPQAFEKKAARDNGIAFIDLDDEIYRALLTPTDPYFASSQYDLANATTGISDAWDRTRGSSLVKVCVADTGQYRAHQDLVGATWGPWKDFIGGKSQPYDDNGHGTHVTGTIGAVIDNGKGIAGIAQVTLLGAKVLNRQGSGSVSAVANGISWCADQGAHVINLSLGGGYSSAIEAAVKYAAGKGALIVAAAGNSGPCSNCVDYPAKLTDAFAVACTDEANAQCTFSSEGPEVDIAAPGKGIVSTWPAGVQPCARKNTNCYVSVSGTSMSTPHVVGLAALIKSADPSMTGAGLRTAIESSARDLGAAGVDAEFGHGLIRGSAVP